MKDLIQVDLRRWQVRILRQRIHHGPVGLGVGFVLLISGSEELRMPAIMLMAWGWTDLHDRSVWFLRGLQDNNFA